MENTQAVTTSSENNPNKKIYATIAEKVRGDLEKLGMPIHIEDLGKLFPELKPEQIFQHLAEMLKLEEYADIKVMTSTSGATYLYSESFVSAAEANDKVIIGETEPKLTHQVQKNTQECTRLTPVEALAEYFPDLSPAQLERCVTALLEKDPNIKQVTGPTGIAYLYSEEYMTMNYATLLARVEARNSYATIAETVREESRIYPRPTKIALFYEPVFQIDPNLMQASIDSMLQQEEYKDIKRIVASTGAVYLYSTLYMSADFAEARVRWEEVDRYTNQ